MLVCTNHISCSKIILFTITGTIGIIGAQYWGKNQKEKVNDIFLIGLKLSVIVSVLFFGLCGFSPLNERCAAIATLISRIVELILSVVIIKNTKKLYSRFKTRSL